jgi:hypothetical protein
LFLLPLLTTQPHHSSNHSPPQTVKTLLKGWAGRISLFRKWKSVLVESKGNGDHYSKVGWATAGFAGGTPAYVDSASGRPRLHVCMPSADYSLHTPSRPPPPSI